MQVMGEVGPAPEILMRFGDPDGRCEWLVDLVFGTGTQVFMKLDLC